MVSAIEGTTNLKTDGVALPYQEYTEHSCQKFTNDPGSPFMLKIVQVRVLNIVTVVTYVGKHAKLFLKVAQFTYYLFHLFSLRLIS